ncbi:hypothetical protein [Virgibacillus siamensis]|uniref:hypothetical protein n=1 Tax=Virgibacillus siamensis TaxID=480071 RepID=UPI000985DC6A|nr:hypothetical protein [Virgibacillus siamensis]
MAEQKYYVTGNTAEGLVNFLDTNIERIQSVFLLQHPSQKFKSEVLRKLMGHYKSDAEILLSPLGKAYLDGFITREKSLAVLDSTITDDGTFILLDRWFPSTQKIDPAFNTFIQRAHTSFEKGLRIHDELEKIYFNQMNFVRADEFAEEFIDNLLKDKASQGTNGHIFHRFFGTNTPDGVVNEVPHLIKDIKNVDYIKGRAGTGKSTFMKKLAKACAAKGFDTEVYHCSFDPNSLDMVLVRGLDFCIFDSTDPHEFFPKREGEQIVDLYKEFVVPGTDEKFADEIEKWNNRYKAYMKEGIHYLKKSGAILEEAEQKKYSQEDVQQAVEYIVHNYLR